VTADEVELVVVDDVELVVDDDVAPVELDVVIRDDVELLGGGAGPSYVVIDEAAPSCRL
jgi:phage baseplate assembly protein gpV